MLSLNFLGALSSLLPGYIQGRRQAIQDNWQDLQNYNNIQQGQLNNAFTEATWQPRLDMFADNAKRNNAVTLRTVDDYNLYHYGMLPGLMDQYSMWSNNAGLNQYYQNMLQNRANQMMLGMPPGALLGMMSGRGQQGLNPTPSGITG